MSKNLKRSLIALAIITAFVAGYFRGGIVVLKATEQACGYAIARWCGDRLYEIDQFEF